MDESEEIERLLQLAELRVSRNNGDHLHAINQS
jgi:hypothetical protein